MSQSNSVENPYLQRYDSVSPEPAEAQSPLDYDSFESSEEFSDFSAEGYGAEDLQRVQEGQSDAPSDEALFADWDEEYFSGSEYEANDFDGAEALKSLESSIEEAVTVSPEAKALLLEELQELQGKYLEGGVDPEDLRYEVEALSDQLQSTLDEVKSKRKDDQQGMSDALKQLLDQDLKHPRLEIEAVAQFTEQVQNLQSQLSEPGADLTAVGEKIDSIKQKITKAIKTDELTEGMAEASGKVPKSGLYWRVTQDLSDQMVDALETGNWAEVETFLYDHQSTGESNNKRRKRFERRIKRRIKRRGEDKNFRDKLEWEYSHKAVQQFVGTLLYQVGGGDETKLDALLSNIPKDVIQTMIGSLEYAKHDLNDTQFAGDEAEKQINGYYGTAAETADRLRRHLEWNPDNYFESDSSLGLDQESATPGESAAV